MDTNNIYWLFGGKLEILADEQTTAASYDLITGTFEPGVAVPPHQHHQYTESILVMEGELTVQINGQTRVLKTGDHVFVPRSTPHAIQNTGTVTAKAVTVASPSNFARLVREVGLPGQADGSAPTEMNDLAAFMRLSAEVGDELVLPQDSNA